MNLVKSGSLNTLKFGQTLLTKVKCISDSKLELEFAEFIVRPTIGCILNSNSFVTKPRLGWIRSEYQPFFNNFHIPEEIQDLIYTLEPGATIELNILNPYMAELGSKYRIRLQLVEQSTPFYTGQKPKINPEKMSLLIYNNKPIYATIKIIISTESPKHQVLHHDRELLMKRPKTLLTC